MEHKAWLWRRKASERNITAGNKSDLALSGNEEKEEKALELERSLQDLKQQLFSARAESNAKDELLDNQTKVAEEAIAGWKKAETEAESFKQELDDIQLQKKAAEERIAKIDAALKECMQQLRASKEEHQHLKHDAATKISREQEKARVLEKKLAETNTKLAKLVAESSNLGRILEVKERLIEDLSNSQSQSEADFTAIVARLDSSEKDNDSLKYEVCMLQKELEIRNQDRDFHLKSADASHRQYLESLKKVTRLESECQRLRVMVRKRLPGPAAIAKMRNEVEMLGTGVTESRRNKTRSFVDTVTPKDLESENGYDLSSKRAALLVERLHVIEDENRILKEALVKRNSELHSSRIMIARTASKLSQVETQLEEVSKGQVSLELARSSPVSYDMPLTSISEDGGNEDTVSCAESWASALISELEHFRNGKATDPPNGTNVSELCLMDDFVEMEKLAIVCVDKPSERSSIGSGEVITCLIPKESDSKDVESTGKEMVPVNLLSNFNETNHKNQSSCISLDDHPPWLQDILQVIMQKHHSTGKSLDTIVEEVCVALRTRSTFAKGNPLDALSMPGNMSQKNAHSTPDPLSGALDATMLKNEASKKFYESNTGKPLLKLIELIEGIIQISTSNRCQQILDRNLGSTNSEDKSAPPSGHVARFFLWETSELSSVLQHFLVVCNDLLHRKADIEKFTSELASTLDWIINHCFSLQDVSTIKEGIKKLFHGEESVSENEFESGITEGKQEPEELNFTVGSSSPLPTTSNGLNISSQMEEIVSAIKDENMKLRYQIINMESTKKELEERLKAACTDNESLSTQLKEAAESIASLQAEVAAGNDLKELIEDQIVNQKLITEDLRTQLTVAKAELNVAHQKFCSLAVEMEDKSNCCEELETTCLDLQLQLESVTAEETANSDKGQAENQLRADLEISAASEKLAECQATILNLGKQLKAMAAPQDVPLFDKVISSPTAARANRHLRLLDQKQTEDGARFDHLTSPKTKEIICAETKQPPISSASTNNPNAGLLYGRRFQMSTSDVARQSIRQTSSATLRESFYNSDKSNEQKVEAEVGGLVLVPKRQKGGVSLLRKLLSRRKKESSKKLALAIGS